MKQTMKMIAVFTSVVLNTVTTLATPQTTDVQVEAMSPWGKVWVTYELEEDLEDVFGGYLVVSNQTTGAVYMSDRGMNFVSSKGKHSVMWDMKAQGVVFDPAVVDVLIQWHKGVRLWEGGPYWAECNVGAVRPEDSGWYFWWGDTVGCKWENDRWVRLDGSNNNYSFSSSSCPTYEKVDTWLRNNGWTDKSGNLTAEHDAAVRYWGGNWRMPTKDEISGLVNNCTRTWTTRNGRAGYLVTGKGTYGTKSIFIPAVGSGDGSYFNNSGSNGHFWSSTPYYSGVSNCAISLYFRSGYVALGSSSRNYGFPVRPVAGFTK